MTVLYGGAFDPPHLGHVAVADAARERLETPRLVVLVSERPEHRDVVAPVEFRLELARAAFQGDDVHLDPYPRTVDLLRRESFPDPIFVIGADQFAGFLSWKEPEEVLSLARLAVATRPGRGRRAAPRTEPVPRRLMSASRGYTAVTRPRTSIQP